MYAAIFASPSAAYFGRMSHWKTKTKKGSINEYVYNRMSKGHKQNDSSLLEK